MYSTHAKWSFQHICGLQKCTWPSLLSFQQIIQKSIKGQVNLYDLLLFYCNVWRTIDHFSSTSRTWVDNGIWMAGWTVLLSCWNRLCVTHLLQSWSPVARLSYLICPSSTSLLTHSAVEWMSVYIWLFQPPYLDLLEQYPNGLPLYMYVCLQWMWTDMSGRQQFR